MHCPACSHPFAFPAVIGAYEWLGWRYAKLREKHEREGSQRKTKK